MTTRIHLARSGTYRDAHDRAVTVDADLLKELAETYDPAAFKAPLVLGHPADGAPAYGWVDKLVIGEDGDLYGEVDQVAPDLADAVKRGAYRNVSISWWPKGNTNSPKADAAALRHVGILGAQTPVVKGLTPLSFAAGDEGVVAIEFSEAAYGWRIMRDIARGFREFLIGSAGQEEADRVAPAYLIDSLTQAHEAAINAPAFAETIPNPPIEEPTMTGTTSTAPAPQPAPQPAATPATPPTDLAEREASLAAREAEIAAKEAKIAEDAKAATDRAAIAFADALIKDGKLAPSGKDVVVDIHRRLAGTNEPIAFADGTKRPALAEFAKLFEGASPIIDLSERSKADASTEVDGKSADALSARANQITKDNPAISFAEAVRQAESEAAK